MRSIVTRLFRLLAVAATSTATIVTVSATPPSYALVAPKAPVVLPAAIEDMPSYQPQAFCDPVDKPGVVAFGALLTATYSDTHVVDISRGCASESGTSEHKDGRALDWGADSRNAQQRQEAQEVFSWLFAKDAAGNPNAMLRRLGIMYVIYDKKIWGSWSQSWQPYACSGVTACHQDHVHFSFDWAGAMKKTSFWTGTVAAPMPPPAYVYTSTAFAQVVRVSSRAASVTTPFRVKAGVPYLFTVTGTYRFSPSRTAVADAACSTTDAKTWTPVAAVGGSSDPGLLDLAVSGHHAWRASAPATGSCSAKHTYTRTLTFATTGVLQLSVDDPVHRDNSGTLTVTVQRVAAL